MTSKKKTGGGLRIGVAAVSIVLAVALGATTGAGTYSNFVSTVLGGTNYQTVDDGTGEVISNGEDNGMSLDEWKETADELVQETAEEGAVLLKNDDDALPLAAGSKVTLFGRSSVDLVLGGTGAGGIDESAAVTLKDAMETDGMFEVNETMWDFYKSYDDQEGYTRSNGTYLGAAAEDIYVAEPPVDEYTDEVRASYEEYADAAIVVFSRVGGEGSDMPVGDFGDGTKYLALQDAERAVLEEIQGSGLFDKVIVLINTSNAMELGWLDQDEYGVDAALWIGGVGQSGALGVARILSGEVNPSGHLVDTYAADSYSSPAMQNFGDFTYANADDIVARIGEANSATSYVVYQEGIYVGYRYYETRYSDSVTDPSGTNATSSAGAYMGDTWNYADEVVYPFGYGLSYGSDDGEPYEQEIVSASIDATGGEITVRVTNTGDTAGKSVVQVYAQQPYATGGAEKSAIQLVGFDKTDELAPGESQELTITIDAEDFITYDYEGAQTYVLDAGDYYFAIGNGAHDALNNILAAQGYTTADGMTEGGDASLTAIWTNDEQALLDESYSGEQITNRFESASLEYYGQETGYLTRSDWTTFPESYEGLEATRVAVPNVPFLEYLPFAAVLGSAGVFVDLAFDEGYDILSKMNVDGLSVSYIVSAVLLVVTVIAAAAVTVAAAPAATTATKE